MNLSCRDQDVVEFMDAPDCELHRLLRTHQQLASVNRLLGKWRMLYRSRLRPHCQTDRRYRVLDVGCGNGHLLAELAAWANADGIEFECLGIDLDDRAFAVAAPGIALRKQSVEALAESGERFDFVVCSHVLHHLQTSAVGGFLSAISAITDCVAIVNDIERSRFAYQTFPLIGCWFRGGWILPDGLRSIRRSFTIGELRPILPVGWEAESVFPCRLVADYEAGR
jgi:2-polyprenyl-3-methyl-5-hydroxy-6-metoxy-1,4-benzoquinol methylase